MKVPRGLARVSFICALIIIGAIWWNMSLTIATDGIGNVVAVDDLAANKNIQKTPEIKPLPSSTIKIMIGGDMMFDRHIRAYAEKFGYDSLLRGVSSLFYSADIVLANLEGSITNFQTRTPIVNGMSSGNLIFTFATSTAKAIRRQGISLVSLANNHSANFGTPGLIQTHDWLDKAGVQWFGDPHNASSTNAIVCKKDICIAFVGYHEFEHGLQNIISDITKLSSEGYPVIVMPHWGDEYATTAPARIKEKAQQFVDAGAFAIIGAHPHVRENKEWIGNVPVIYSLGNLVFDQYFSTEVMIGNIAELTITKTGAVTKIDKVRLYTVSNAGKSGPELVGEPIEFPR